MESKPNEEKKTNHFQVAQVGFIRQEEYYDSYADLARHVGEQNAKYYEILGLNLSYVDVKENEEQFNNDFNIMEIFKNTKNRILPREI